MKLYCFNFNIYGDLRASMVFNRVLTHLGSEASISKINWKQDSGKRFKQSTNPRLKGNLSWICDCLVGI